MARTGYKVTVYLDNNPKSPTYMSTYEVREYDTTSCPLGDENLILITDQCEIVLSGYTGYRIKSYQNTLTGEITNERFADSSCSPTSTDPIWVQEESYCEVSDGKNTGYLIVIERDANKNSLSYNETRETKELDSQCAVNECPFWEEQSRSCHVVQIGDGVTFDGTADVIKMDKNSDSDTFGNIKSFNVEDSNCSNLTTSVFSWVAIGEMCGSDNPICSDANTTETIYGLKNKYSVKRKYKTYNGNTYPMDEYELTLVQESASDCGGIEPHYRWRTGDTSTEYICDDCQEVEYRWYTSPSEYLCSGSTKYEKQYYQVSTDGGVTWQNVSPEQTRMGSVIETQSEDCGYVPPTGNYLAVLTLNDGSTVNIEDDGTHILSSAMTYTYRIATVSAEITTACTSIGDSALQNCTSLTSVTIPDSVTSIGGHAFRYCYALTSVTIPDSVTSIGATAFDECSSLRAVTIGNSVTSIGVYSFAYCNSLTSITIPDSVTSIGDSAFRYCSGLTSVIIGNGVTSIGDGAFFNCTSLRGSIEIPSGVTSIEDNVFWYCSGLTEVTIPSGVTSIGDSAFYECRSLTSVTIPDNVTSIGKNAFNTCTSLRGSIEIPSGVTSIEDGVFRHCTSLTAVTIPDSVTSIGRWAFASCSGLTSVVIPSGVTEIGTGSFSYCSGLISVTMPSGVTSIEDNVFGYCSSLTAVTIPDSVTSIGDSAFFRCSSLTSVTIGNSVTSIGEWAFRYSTSLTSVTIPDSVTSIGAYAFDECSSLRAVTIGNSVTSIENDVFNKCSGLTSITVYATTPPSLGTGVFDNTNSAPIYVPCDSLTLYKAATNWSTYEARIECVEPPYTGLCKLTLNDGSAVELQGSGELTESMTSGYSNTCVSAKIGTLCTSIGNRAFRIYNKLSTVEIPSSVISIGGGGFSNCTSLSSVTIPDSVTEIGNDGFYKCSGLTSITCEATTPATLGSDAFKYTNNCRIYVPSSSVDAYKSAWSTYSSRIRAIS